MQDPQWYHFVFAILFGFMIWRMIPVAKAWFKDGPRGSSAEWLNVSLLLGGVVLFVVFLIKIV